MSEFENEYTPDYGYEDPGQIGAGEIDPESLAAVVSQASEIGAQRAMGELLSAQQQQQQAGFQQQAAQTFVEAEAALTAWDPSWPTRAQTAYDTLIQHPTMFPQEALHNPMAAAEALYEAEQWGSAKKYDAQQKLKDADDEGFFRRLKAQADNMSWSSRMSRTGQSVHDVLDGS